MAPRFLSGVHQDNLKLSTAENVAGSRNPTSAWMEMIDGSRDWHPLWPATFPRLREERLLVATSTPTADDRPLPRLIARLILPDDLILEAVDDFYTINMGVTLKVDAPGLLANDRAAAGARLRALLVTAPRNGKLELNPDGSFTYTPDEDFSGTERFTYRATDGMRRSEEATVAITVREIFTEPVPSSFTTEEVTVSEYSGPRIAAITDFSETVDGVLLFWEKAYYQDLDIAGTTPLEIPFGLNRPFGYDPGATARYPLVIYLHGAGARSNWTSSNPDPDLRNHSLVNSALKRQTARFFAKTAQTRSPYYAFVLTPQVPSTEHYWVGTGPDAPYLQTDTSGNTYSEYMHLLENLIPFLTGTANNASLGTVLGIDADDIDLDHIYVVGDSDGAKGTWDILARRPALFAGAIASAGTGPRNKLTELRQTPLWTIHGILDDTVPNALPSETLPYGSGTMGMLALLDPTFDDTASTELIYLDDHAISGDDPLPSDDLIYSEYDETFNHSDVATGWTATASGTLLWLFSQVLGPSNSAPVANGDSYSVGEDIPLNVAAPGVLGNDSDPDGDPLTALLASSPAYGEVTLNPDGSFVYTPNPDFNGNDSFTYRANNGAVDSEEATVAISVTPANDPPIAADDSALTTVDIPVIIRVLDNDLDVDLDPLTVQTVTQGANGTVTNNGGDVTYAPNSGFIGTDSFSYTADDGNGGTDTAMVSVTVATAETLFSDNFDRPDSGTVGGGWIEEETTGAVVDIAAGRLFFSDTTDRVNRPMVSHIFPHVSSGKLTWEFDFNWARTGSESTYRLFMQLGDGALMSADSQDAGVGINLIWTQIGGQHERLGWQRNGTVTALAKVSGQARITVDAFMNTHTFSVAINGVTAGSGIPFDRIVDLNTVRFFTDALNEQNFSGRSFDNLEIRGVSRTANNVPVANDDMYATDKNVTLTVSPPGVLGNDVDAEGDPLTAVLISSPARGTLTLNADGSFTYIPQQGFSGTDSFTYKARNGVNESNVATVTIVVSGLAFPGAEGFGAKAVGGRGGTVMEVTNLNDSGPGSLREAVDAAGPRTVVFRVGGTVELDSPLRILNPFITIAGQTAPGGGVTLKNRANDLAPLIIETHDVIVRYIRSRPGPGTGAIGDEIDGIHVNGKFAHNVIVDHCSISWAVDENFSTWNAAHDVTLQWSILSEGLRSSTHSKGPHSMGVLLGSDGSHSISLHHNFIGHNKARNPRINTAGLVDFVNNVIYNYGTAAGELANDHADLLVNYIGNYVIAGLDSDGGDYEVDMSPSVTPNTYFVYVSGNLGPHRPTDTGSEADIVSPEDRQYLIVSPFSAPPVTTTSAQEALGQVLSRAGASLGIDAQGRIYWRRDPVDARVVGDVRSGTGRIIDDPSQVGGWPALASGTPPADGDHDGMPDEWEILRGLNPLDPSDGPLDPDLDGFTSLEEYLNSLINLAPQAADDSFSTDEDSVNVPLDVLANDSDQNSGDLLTIVSLGAPDSGGSASIDDNDTPADPSDDFIAYTPAPDFAGVETFSYTVQDLGGAANSALVTVAVLNLDDPPAAVGDAFSVDEDSAGNLLDVLANDGDPDAGDILTLTAVGPTDNGGTAVISDGGTPSDPSDDVILYTPAPDFAGAETFSYTVVDGSGLSDSAVVTVTVNNVNDPPAANDDAFSVNEDATLNVPAPGVLGNDTDIDGDPLTAVLVTGTSSGTLALNADGSFSYAPNPDFNGTDGFTYKASDGSLDSETATVTITVTAVGEPPVAVNDSYATAEDTPLNVAAPGVLGNDTDAEGDPLTAILVTGPASGALTLNADGSFSYAPNPDFNGTDGFTYKANDGTADSGAAAVTITVTAVNDTPAAVNDSYTVAEDTLLTVAVPGVLGNDTDVDGDALTAILVTGTASGALTLNADGSFTYTPNADFNGIDSFTYKANDGTLDSGNATVTITVTVVNNAPVAVNDSYSTAEDNALTVATPGVLGNDTDIDGDALTAIPVSGPSSGTLSLNADGSFTYTPNVNFYGTDGFTYKASDGALDSASATVTITVSPVNDSPVANDDSATTTAGAPVTIDVLANDTDVDLDPLTVASVTQGAAGAVTNNGSSVTYTPNAGFSGSDSFDYTVSDGKGGSDTATVTVTVEGDTTLFGDGFARPDSAEVGNGWVEVEAAGATVGISGGRLTFTDTSDVTNRPMVSHAFSRIDNGRLSWEFDFDWTRTGKENTYRLFMQLGDGALMTTSSQDDGVGVNLVWTKIGSAQERLAYRRGGSNTAIATVRGQARITVEADLDAHAYAVAVDGTTVASGIPFDRIVGLDTVRFFTDGLAEQNFSGRSFDDVEIRRIAGTGNTPPVAGNDSYDVDEDAILNVAAPGVLGNDSDADGNPLTAILVTGPISGTLTLNADGSFTYAPNADFNGSDSFTYKANDGAADSNVATVAITVNPLNDPPVAADQQVSTFQNTPVVITLSASDADGDPLTYSVVASPANGVLSGAPPELTYAPDAGFTGTDIFTFQANDGTADSNVATVTVTVTAATILLNDDFNRSDSGTVGNGWTEVEASGATVGISSSRLTFTDTSDVTNRPMVSHGFAKVSSGKVTWEFDFDWTRTGNEGVYRLFMQLGDGALMTTASQDAGVGVNLIWTKIGGTHERLGYRQAGSDTAIATVRGPARITVEADLSTHTYAVAVGGVTVASGLPFDQNVALDTARFFTDALNEQNISGRNFDNLVIRR